MDEITGIRKALRLSVLVPLLTAGCGVAGDSPIDAATSVNTVGIELLRQTGEAGTNVLLSPYSIQSALAMAYVGAEGVTREQMAKTLHLPRDASEVDRSFAELRRALEAIQEESNASAARDRQYGVTNTPLTVTVANRLFGQEGFRFRDSFLASVRDSYGAPFEALNFSNATADATKQINGWVENITRNRIRDLIPPGALNEMTRLVLVNAIYLKAPWEKPFPKAATQPRPFYLPKRTVGDRATMNRQGLMGYRKDKGFSIVAIPYSNGALQFLVLLPDKEDGLAGLERGLTPGLLAGGTNLPPQEIMLYLPKFKLTPPLFRLGQSLRTLGMKSAFNDPPGSANFSGIAPRRGAEYLYLSEVFHKTFLDLDETGTEAAAATAATISAASAVVEKSEPIEVRVNHPFLFAIQHRASGACLFLGRVVDPESAMP